jgi:C-terminal processing protease CtpA/Prc
MMDEQTISPYLSVTEKIYGLSLLWREAFYNFAFFDRLPDLDWNQAYRDALPQAMAAADTFSYYRVLARFLALLQDGHTGIFYPADLLSRHLDFPAVALRELDHRAVVIAVDHSFSNSLPLGSLITAIDRTPVEEVLRSSVLPYVFASSEETLWDMAVRGVRMFGYGLLAGTPGSQVDLTYATPQGDTGHITVRRDLSSRPVEWLGRPNIDPPAEMLEFTWLQDGIAYVALNRFNDEQIVHQFETIKPELLRANVVILDMRRNQGGSTGIGAAILDHFSQQELVGSLSRTRQSVAARRAWSQFGGEHTPHQGEESWLELEPQRRPVIRGPKILAPTVVLIGRETVSAAEDFLVLADPLPHFTTIGEPTCGTTGQPLAFDLPGGGIGFIVTKHDTYPDGREFVGPGIQPKVRIETTIEDIRQGIDPDLEAALNWIHAQTA